MEVAEKDLKSTDRKYALNCILKAWLPLSPTILEMVAHCLPSPVGSSAHRVFRLMPAPTLKEALSPQDAAALSASRKAVASCATSPGATTAAFVSKMLAVPASAVHGVAPDDKSTIFMGFGQRLFWRVTALGDTIYVVNDAYDPSAPEACGRSWWRIYS